MTVQNLINELNNYHKDVPVLITAEHDGLSDEMFFYEIYVCTDLNGEVLYDENRNCAVTLNVEDFEEDDYYDPQFSKNNPNVVWKKAIAIHAK